jgi:hypothetical protein
VAREAAGAALADLERLVGKWELRPAGAPAASPPEHLELAWELDGAVMRQSQRRTDDGKRWQASGLIAWNPAAGRIEVFRHEDTGGATRGTAAALDDGAIRFELERIRPDGTRQAERTELRRTDEQTLELTTRRRSGDAWSEPELARARLVTAFPWEVRAT